MSAGAQGLRDGQAEDVLFGGENLMGALDIQDLHVDELLVFVKGGLKRDSTSVAHEETSRRGPDRSTQPNLREAMRVNARLLTGHDLICEAPRLVKDDRAVPEAEGQTP